MLVFMLTFAQLVGAAEGTLRQVGVARIGFGVPGHGTVVIRDNLAVVPPGEGDFTLVDITDKTRPVLAGYIPTLTFNQAIYFHGPFGYFHNSRGGTFVSDLSQFAPAAEPGGLRIHGTTAIPYDERRNGPILHISEPFGVFASCSTNTLHIFRPDGANAPRHVADCALPNGMNFAGFYPIATNWALVFATRGSPVKPKKSSGPDDPLRSGKDGVSGELYRWDFTDLASSSLTPVFALQPDERILALTSNHLATLERKTNTVRMYDRYGDTNGVHEPVRFPLPPQAGHLVCAFHDNHFYLLDGRGGPGQYSLTYESPHSRWFVYELGRAEMKPSYMFEHALPSAFGSLSIRDGYGYVNDYNYGLRIFDLHDPGKPAEIGACPTAAEGSGLHLDAARNLVFLWVTFGGTIYAMDVADPAKPRVLSYYHDGAWVQYSNQSRANMMAGKGTVLFCSRKNKVAILDTADPRHIRNIGFLMDDGGRPVSGLIKGVGDRLYLVAGGQRLLLYDIATPQTPQWLGSFTLPKEGKPLSLTVRDNRIYLITENHKLLILDAMDPQRMTVSGTVDLDSFREGNKKMYFPDVAVSAKGYAYLTSGENRERTRLLVANVRAPGAPIKWVESDKGGYWADWACFNRNMVLDDDQNLLYVCKYMQIECFDISQPENPRCVAVTGSLPNRRSPPGQTEEPRCVAVTGLLDDFQWTIGAVSGAHVYVPGLRYLHILKYVDGIQPLAAEGRLGREALK
ncbi:MAG: hypothetical protein HY360_18900 [Verrucomicrobia bacterium]|nr:hypothetical protein [Verrucomicrobiota bacterium]